MDQQGPTLPALRSLDDDAVSLEPLAPHDADGMLELAQQDDVVAYTRVPGNADAAFVESWIGRYEQAWHDGRAAGFAIRDATTRSFLGFAGIVDLQLRERQGEVGYMLLPCARGRGAATRAVELLGRWAFRDLELERLEMVITPDNTASRRVAERARYRFEGTLRHVFVKEGVRGDVEVWSRLRTDA